MQHCLICTHPNDSMKFLCTMPLALPACAHRPMSQNCTLSPDLWHCRIHPRSETLCQCLPFDSQHFSSLFTSVRRSEIRTLDSVMLPLRYLLRCRGEKTQSISTSFFLFLPSLGEHLLERCTLALNGAGAALLSLSVDSIPNTEISMSRYAEGSTSQPYRCFF